MVIIAGRGRVVVAFVVVFLFVLNTIVPLILIGVAHLLRMYEETLLLLLGHRCVALVIVVIVEVDLRHLVLMVVTHRRHL